MAPRGFARSLRGRLLATFALMTVFALGLLGYGLVSSGRLLREQTIRQLDVMTTSEVGEIRTGLERLWSDMKTMATLPALDRNLRGSAPIQSFDPQAQSVIAEQLRIFASAKKCYLPTQVSLKKSGGQALIRLVDSGGGLTLAEGETVKLGWNGGAEGVGESTPSDVRISKPFRSGPDQEPGIRGGTQIIYSTPVRAANNKAWGSLDVQVRVDYLLTHVKQRPPNGVAFLLTRDGGTLAYDSSTASGVGLETRDVTNLPPELEDAEVARVVSGTSGSLVSSKGWVVSYVPFPVGDPGSDRYWVFGMATPESAFLAPVRRLAWISAILFGIATLGLGVLYVMLRRDLLNPIRELSHGAHLIAGGKLDHRIQVQTGDEMKSLADQFNRMAEQVAQSQSRLKSWNEDLSRQVEAQTADLQESQERLRAEKQKLDDIVSAIGARLCVFSADRRVVWANRLLAEECGGLEKVVGRPCYEVNYGRREPCEVCLLKNILAGARVERRVLAHRNGGSTERYYQVVASPVRNGARAVDQVVELSTDITEFVVHERVVQRRLSEAEKLATLGQISAGVAHEVANPLAAIKTILQVLKDDAGVPNGHERYVDQVLDQVDRLSAFLDHFTAFAKPHQENRKRWDLNTIVREVEALCRAEIRKRGVTLTTELSPAPIYAEVDPAGIQQVVLNLLLNALEATPSGGLISIRSRTSGNGKGAVRLEIADSGTGIRPEHADKIFEPFFTTKPNGTGLGLSITHRIVAGLGGSIQVGPRPGGGTEFVVELQAQPEERARPTTSSEAPWIRLS